MAADFTMDSEAEKKYNVLENIFQKINQKYVALPNDETKSNNQILSTIDKIIQKMRSNSALFRNLYQNKYHGGSYYDGLKVGKPSEYDLDCVLRLPKAAVPTVEVSDKPGFVHVTVNIEALKKKVDEAPKYEGLEKLLDGNRLSSKNVRSWIESVMMSVLPKSIDGVNLTTAKSGPAITIKLEGEFQNKNFCIDVDMVPCFTFFDDQWPTGNYRTNPSTTKNTFFVVPKSPSEEDVHYWRLSFQDQERELINDYSVMKPTIRLIKKIRDRYQHRIASYYIKTVFLWELEKCDTSFWRKPLSYVFMTMLTIYADYISNRNIPYYWNQEYNLIENLSFNTVSCIANKIRNIVAEIERNYFSNPYSVLDYFLLQHEYDIEVFKKEAPLSKKHLKKLESCSKIVNVEHQLPSVSSSSASSSFEEIPRIVDESSKEENTMLKLQVLCTTLLLEQQKMTSLLETVNSKIDTLEANVKLLQDEMVVKLIEEKNNRKEMEKMIIMLNQKVDDLVEKNRLKGDLEPLLPTIDDMLKTTTDFLRK